MLLMFMITNFSQPIKLFLLVSNAEEQFYFLLSGDQIYFDFLSLTAHQKKNLIRCTNKEDIVVLSSVTSFPVVLNLVNGMR